MQEKIRERLRRELESGSMAWAARELVALSTPAARTVLTRNAAPVQLGASRVAGIPDLPADWQWPEAEGQALAFLAQIDLSELPEGADWPVPEAGFVYIFLQDDESAGFVKHKTLYSGGPRDALQPREMPEKVCEIECMEGAPPYRLSFELSLQLPNPYVIGRRNSERSAPGVHTGVELLAGDESDETYSEERRRIEKLPEFKIAESTSMFGAPEEWSDNRFYALMHDQGLGDLRYQAHLGVEGYKRARGVHKNLPRFEAFKARQAEMEIEARNWGRLFEVGSLRHEGNFDFLWWDAGSLEVLGDYRRTRLGDFSRTFACIHTT